MLLTPLRTPLPGRALRALTPLLPIHGAHREDADPAALVARVPPEPVGLFARGIGILEGKPGYHWQLWVFQSRQAVVFQVEPTRAGEVVLGYFGESATGILSVDRYVAYKVLLKSGRIVLAYCWAHVRRDFVRIARDWGGQHQRWALGWVECIGELYRLNGERLRVLDDAQAFRVADGKLREAVERLVVWRQAELAQASLVGVRRKVLKSMNNHWAGLIVFLQHPEVPMDNNTAERAQRTPVVGRKNYYGSGAEWSGNLAAMMFSIFQIVPELLREAPTAAVSRSKT